MFVFCFISFSIILLLLLWKDHFETIASSLSKEVVFDVPRKSIVLQTLPIHWVVMLLLLTNRSRTSQRNQLKFIYIFFPLITLIW